MNFPCKFIDSINCSSLLKKLGKFLIVDTRERNNFQEKNKKLEEKIIKNITVNFLEWWNLVDLFSQ